MYQPTKHGRADYGSYMQVPWEAISGMVEGDDSKPLIEQRFARLVYSVNPTQLSISGAQISIDKVGLKTSDEVGVTSGGINAYIVNSTDDNEIIFSTIIQSLNSDTYIAEAPVGTSYATSGWRVQKIDTNGSASWYDNAKYSAPANIDLSTLTYNP
jgi:hypothetical protein